MLPGPRTPGHGRRTRGGSAIRSWRTGHGTRTWSSETPGVFGTGWGLQAARGGAIIASSRGDRDAAKLFFFSSMRAGSIVDTMVLLMAAIVLLFLVFLFVVFVWC